MRGDLQGLGPFRLLSVLGEGETAVVYEAEHDADGGLGTRRALKVARPTLDAAAKQAFQERSATGQVLDHPGIPRTLELGVSDGVPWMLLERVDGVSLAEMLPARGKPRFKEAPAAELVCGILSALAAAEEDGLIHGRLDPTHVLVDLSGEVSVIAFGVADDPRGDLLSVARLAASLCPTWPADFHAWCDTLQAESLAYTGPAEALAASPVGASAEGRLALSRAVKRTVKRKEKAAADAAGPKPAAVQAESAPPAAERPPPQRPRRAQRQRPDAPATRPKDGRSPTYDELAPSVRQARWVGAICAAVVIAALVLEIMGHTGS